MSLASIDFKNHKRLALNAAEGARYGPSSQERGRGIQSDAYPMMGLGNLGKSKRPTEPHVELGSTRQ